MVLHLILILLMVELHSQTHRVTLRDYWQATYDVAVQDALGCIVTGTVSVTDQGGPVINGVTPISPLCNGTCDGSLSIDATGATQFSVDGGATFQGINAFTNLCAGNYDIMVENAIGCQATSSTVLNDPLALSYAATLTDVLCSGQCTGEIDITAVWWYRNAAIQ